MPSIRLKNTSTIILHGKRPGQEWSVETDASGVVLDETWRRRLLDEADFRIGHVTVVGPAPVTSVAAASLPLPASSEAPEKD